MAKQEPGSDAAYFLGFDGGGTKTDCILSDDQGRVLARAAGGPSNPLRAGYTRAWFSLSEAADCVLGRQEIRVGQIRGICAGVGGASRNSVTRDVTRFFERRYPNAQIRVTTDIEIAFEAAFGTGEGIVLLAGTGSAAYGRSRDLRTARAGGGGPWFSDEGGAFDIGRRAFGAIVLAEEHRGPATALSGRIFKWHHARNWDSLLEQIAKNPDDVFPKTLPLVAELADAGDDVARAILLGAAASLAELAACVANELDWRNHEVAIAKVGGVYGRSKHFDAAIEEALKKVLPRACVISPKVLPAEAAAHIAIQLSQAKGNAT